MATGIVITVAEKVFAVLHSQELKEICSMFGYESQLDELKTTVFTIKSVLLDVESKHQELTCAGRDYIERLKDAVYDVDDLLDEFNTVVQKANSVKGGKVSKKVNRFFSRSNQFLVAYNMSHEIKNLRSKLDKIAKDRQQFGFGDAYVPLKRREETISFASEDYIIGRETDKETIVGMLIGDLEPLNDIDYVTIVGIGGLGKTALAQLVYNDCRIEKAFDLRLWVCVSEDFFLEKIFRQMLGGKDGSNKEELQRKARKLIQGKRYLLVLDDVWSESRDEWDNLKSFLNLGGKGSRVVITSRSKKVAIVVGDDHMYELKGLSDDDSWNLFKRLAFKHGKEPVNSEDHLFDVGKEIVKKCVNVPLSIRVVGSMLYDQVESKWLSFRSASLMEIEQDEGGIMPILKYSYYHLPLALKTCFSYFALFPKDFMIKKELLIRLWLAQGCLDKPHSRQSEDDIGDEYFSILLQRCFLQDVENNIDGEIISCKIHDLIHDLAHEVAGEEIIIFDSPKGEFDKRIRHISLTKKGHGMLGDPTMQLNDMRTLRTFFAADAEGVYPKLLDSSLTTICLHLRRLRVLYLASFKFDTLPDTVGNLLHLRYLDLSRNERLKFLPNSITKLLNLLVLNLDLTGVKELPQDMRKLVNLRQLSLRGCFYLRHMPPGLDTLTHVYMLSKFVSGNETSKQGKIGKLRDLKALINLRDELTIQMKDNFRCDVTEYEGIELLRLAPLKRLNVDFRDHGAAIHETVLGCLQPHCRLLTISIEGYRGSKLPTWTEALTTSLPHLVRIHLERFDCLPILPSLSQLRHLKYLTLRGIYNVEFVESDGVVHLDNHLTFFPSLEELQLLGLPKLKGWWREETNTVTGEACSSSVIVPSFPRLLKLVMRLCPNLTAFPSCPKLISLSFVECHEALSLLRTRTSIPRNLHTSFELHLEELTIDNVGALDCLFGESLRGIRHLIINRFEGKTLSNIAVLLSLGYSIKNLEICNCKNLKSLFGFVEHLNALRSLTIDSCINLELENNEELVTAPPWKSFHLISSLTLCSVPKLINLPKEFQYLTALEYLAIIFCTNLEALPEWLNRLTSLQTLSIVRCTKLKSFPEAISEMPSLKTLDLRHSNENLRKNVKRDGGDWSKVLEMHETSLACCLNQLC